MSASDSDYSIDWLASDEDDTDGPDRSSPSGHPDDVTDGPDRSSPPRRHPDAQPPPTSTTCLRDPPRNRVVHSVGSVDKKSGDDDSDSKDGHQHCRLQSQCSNNNGSTDDSSDCSSSPVSKQNFWASPVQGYTTTCVGQQIPSRALRSTAGVVGKPLEMRKRVLGPGHCETSRSEDTDKELFSRKCTELQCYIQPLSSILRGLRSGRYSQRLSGFQESVAMDRIQRIMGVLQKPVMGERFLNIVLKMEAMLHSWFPEVKGRAEQQHTDHVTPAKRQKHHTTANQSSSSPSSARPVASGVTAAGPVPGSFSASQVRWVHTSPVCSRKTSELPSARTTPAAAAAATPHPSRGVLLLQAMQDNVVSSSTDLQNGPKSNPPHGRGAVPFKISSPCLQRLLQAKESIIGPRTVGDDGTL